MRKQLISHSKLFCIHSVGQCKLGALHILWRIYQLVLLSMINLALIFPSQANTPADHPEPHQVGIVVDSKDKGLLNVPMTIKSTPSNRKLPAELLDTSRSQDASPKPWRKWQHASGDWRGFRPWLLKHGIIPEIVYTTEVFGNLNGGKKTGIQALGNLDFTVTLDTQRIGLWDNGTFFIYVQNSHGKGISAANVGNEQTISNIDPRPRYNWTQLSAFFYHHRAYADSLEIIIGKQDANTLFAVPNYADPLLNSSFELTLTVPMPTFPDPELGGAIVYTSERGYALSAGIYNGNSKNNGNRSMFSNLKGIFAITEVGISPTFSGYSGEYRMGAWVNSNGAKAITRQSEPIGTEALRFDNDYGFYLAFDQQIIKPTQAANNHQDMGVFFQLGWAPQDRNETTLYVGAGVTLAGPFQHRFADNVGFAIAYADLSGKNAETVLEMFYQAEITPWLNLKPDIQYVINPDGNGDNAFVLGLRMQWIL